MVLREYLLKLPQWFARWSWCSRHEAVHHLTRSSWSEGCRQLDGDRVLNKCPRVSCRQWPERAYESAQSHRWSNQFQRHWQWLKSARPHWLSHQQPWWRSQHFLRISWWWCRADEYFSWLPQPKHVPIRQRYRLSLDPHWTWWRSRVGSYLMPQRTSSWCWRYTYHRRSRYLGRHFARPLWGLLRSIVRT